MVGTASTWASTRSRTVIRRARTELLAFRAKVTASANETFEAWRERDHDDLVLAVATAAWVGEHVTQRLHVWV
jgi:hypothetical protein